MDNGGILEVSRRTTIVHVSSNQIRMALEFLTAKQATKKIKVCPEHWEGQVLMGHAAPLVLRKLMQEGGIGANRKIHSRGCAPDLK